MLLRVGSGHDLIIAAGEFIIVFGSVLHSLRREHLVAAIGRYRFARLRTGLPIGATCGSHRVLHAPVPYSST